ncbi:MAG TPA: hypothetical protein VML55_10125 [Planctomycetaceae bacterium]|nr:hypothetical protein [Planctomycetaceae bacterium]
MRRHETAVSVAFVAAVLGALSAPPPDARAGQPDVIDIGARRELFVDRQLIDRLAGVELRLHPPQRAETVLRFDQPWEGPTCAYVTVFQDGDRFRMYYRGSGSAAAPEITCYAESTDGIVWTRPALGLFEWNGSKDNNIVWHHGYGSHNFTPFKDARPGVPDGQRYKALGSAARGTRGLVAFVSPDGLHWQPLRDEPVLTKGAFDSQNLAFWDARREKYVAYYRIFTDGVRAIATAESDDFVTWTDPVPIELDGPAEHFYTNATTPYFRGPHYYFAFPKRFVPGRKRLAEPSESGISDAVFLSSRDGRRFDRTFPEALLRPGPDERNWGDRSTMVAWGLVPTAAGEMSIYFSQHYRHGSHHLSRGVFRVDGIASARAGAAGGELVTRPIRFDGERLRLNYATSAAGSVQVELQTPDGQPIAGFALADSEPLYGDALDEPYSWKSGADVSKLAGQPVRLRFILKDADLYAYRFAAPGTELSEPGSVADELGLKLLHQLRDEMATASDARHHRPDETTPHSTYRNSFAFNSAWQRSASAVGGTLSCESPSLAAAAR